MRCLTPLVLLAAIVAGAVTVSAMPQPLRSRSAHLRRVKPERYPLARPYPLAHLFPPYISASRVNLPPHSPAGPSRSPANSASLWSPSSHVRRPSWRPLPVGPAAPVLTTPRDPLLTTHRTPVLTTPAAPRLQAIPLPAEEHHQAEGPHQDDVPHQAHQDAELHQVESPSQPAPSAPRMSTVALPESPQTPLSHEAALRETQESHADTHSIAESELSSTTDSIPSTPRMGTVPLPE
ncbi:hypothetical protein BC835DRAFT_276946 [Cytidiella melzeri]|nr:hypothetical protein BC835DRAFT_276946 [Cytidiella melzeri]